MISRYLILRQRIETELADVDRAAIKIEQAISTAIMREEDASFYLDSVALNLHGLYNGIERIFEVIARDVEGSAPSGAQWHRNLLVQMTLDVEGLRPPVIGRETCERLEEYLRFRHLVRNLYTWSFSLDKLTDLVEGLAPTLSFLRNDLVQFGRFLDAASHADIEQ